MNRTKQTNAYLLLMLVIITSGCSRMIKDDPYLTTKSQDPLVFPEGVDEPNTTNALTIPKLSTNAANQSTDINPPDIRFANRRSKDEQVKLVSYNDLPTLELYNAEISPWQLIQEISLNNWQTVTADEQSCQQTLQFTDVDNIEVQNRGFFKRIFTNEKAFVDRSGQYTLSCQTLSDKKVIIMRAVDGQKLYAGAVDLLMGDLFDRAAAKQN